VVLGYSRLIWLRFYSKQDMRTLFSGLEEAFTFFGGMPRELRFDQIASVITADLRDQGGRLIENAEFLRFAAHCGLPSARMPTRPSENEGKVERRIRYLRGTFLYGREFLGVPISPPRPRPGWSRPPKYASTALPEKSRSSGSPAMSGTSFGPWLSGPIAR
jgi:transposase